MSAFLITGLPRSRTAWMSLAANNERSICHHEPIANFKRWEDVGSLWQSTDYEHVGVSDSSMGLHLKEILSRCSPRTLIIDRDIASVVGSLDAIGLEARKYSEVLQRRLALCGAHSLVKRVDYYSLTDSHIVAECLRWLMPGIGVDMNKLQELQRMNVQTDMEIVRRTANQRRADIPALMGADVVKELASISA